MNEFLKFFEETVKSFPMHLEINYNMVADWKIYVYRKGWGKNGKDLVIVDVSGCDMDLCFAKAQVQLKEWLVENNGGY